MSAPHPWRDSAAPYALDALDGEERAAFESHLRECAECRSAVAEMREVAGLLAYAAAPAAPSERLRERILADARRSGAVAGAGRGEARAWSPAPAVDAGGGAEGVVPIASRRRVSRAPWLAAAASLALAVLGGAGYWRERQERVAAQGEVRAALGAARAARAEVAERDSLLAHVLGPEVLTTTLAATGEAPAMRLFWDRSRGVMVASVRNLPSAPAGRTYQLWGIPEGGQPVSLGTFDPGADGEAVVVLSVPRGLALGVSAVTEEPAGGSPAPTTTPFLAGSWGGSS